MLMRRDVLRGFWDEGEAEPTGECECWIAGSDSDSDDPDTHRGLFIRVVNTDAYLSDSLPDGIYPGPDHHHSTYSHAHLRDFSQAAIKQYNQDTGNRFEFVELVEASLHTHDHIQVIFKACQSSNDTVLTTSFRAETRSASKSLSHFYHIDTVVPLHSNSDV